MNPFPPPRAWVDWSVPLRADGTPINRTLNQEEYEQYVEWLADYLFENDFPVPECQEDLEGFPCFVPDEFDPRAFEDLERMIGEGWDYDSYLKHMTEQWKEYFKELQEQFPDSEESDEASARKYFFDVCVATEKQFARTAREMAEQKAKGVSEWIDHADIPYRAVFARTLKKMPSHEERVAALRAFYGRLCRELDEVFGK
jgi:hypothetical protein